jgi:hypothetical protein
MFLDGPTAGIYGKLDAWADNDKAFDLVISGHGFHPGRGLIILGNSTAHSGIPRSVLSAHSLQLEHGLLD